MGQYVKFEAKKLFKTLNVLEQSQLKYSGGRALRKLGFEMKKNVIPKQMKANFRIGFKFLLFYSLKLICPMKKVSWFHLRWGYFR